MLIANNADISISLHNRPLITGTRAPPGLWSIDLQSPTKTKTVFENDFRKNPKKPSTSISRPPSNNLKQNYFSPIGSPTLSNIIRPNSKFEPKNFQFQNSDFSKNRALSALETPMLPLTNQPPLCRPVQTNPNVRVQFSPTDRPLLAYAHSAYERRPKQELAVFLHATAGYPPAKTFCQAIDAGFFATWPGLTSTLIRKHLPKSVPSVMGRMRRHPKGVRSTTKPKPPDGHITDVTDDTLPPPRPLRDRRHLVGPTVVNLDNLKGVISTDLPGRFPFPSSRGMNYVFLLYDYDSNAILVEPIKSRNTDHLIEGYDACYNRLVAAGVIPVLHRLDNEISDDMRASIKAKDLKYQLSDTYDHHAQPAERHVGTYKNHLGSILNGCDADFPPHLWCRTIRQSEITINSLRRSRINPKLSAYTQLFGIFDFNTTPMVPIGTRAIIYEDRVQRANTWANHGQRGWYVGPSMEHYRNYDIFVTKTRRVRNGKTIEFFPTKYTLPATSSDDRAAAAVDDLVHELRNPQYAGPFLARGTATNAALRKLRTLLPDSPTAASTPRVPTVPPPRVPIVPPPRVSVVPPAPPTVRRNKTLVFKPTIQVATFNAATIPSTPPPTHTAHLNGIRRDWKIPPLPDSRTARDYKQYKDTPGIHDSNILLPTVTTRVTRSRLLSAPFSGGLAKAASLLALNSSAFQTTLHEGLAVTHHKTGRQLEYRHLITDAYYKDDWLISGANEFGRLAQGIPSRGIEGTDTIFFIHAHEVPSARTVTYARIVCSVRPEKEEKNRMRMTVGGNLITDYPGETSTESAALETIKIHWNHTLSTPDAKSMTMDIKNMYLNTKLDRYEYMKVHINLIPEEIIALYNLRDKVSPHGFVFIEIRGAMYGLRQAGRLANDQLQKVLAKGGYVASTQTPGLFLHRTRKISFCLVVDDFSVSYVDKADALHLEQTIKNSYPMTSDWTGSRYIGIDLDWDYNKRTLRTSMNGYIEKALLQFQHPKPKQHHFAPSTHTEPTYGARIQLAKVDSSPPMTPTQTKFLERVCGKFLYIARALDDSTMHAINDLASNKNTGTQNTYKELIKLLDYCASNPNPTKMYRASDMILAVDSDAAYLVASKARSRAGGYFYLTTKDGQRMNASIAVTASIMRVVMSSASEAELGALFLNARKALPMRHTLIELGHAQPPTKIKTDNSTADGIVNGTIKPNRSKAMDMRFFWLCCRVNQGQFKIYWAPGAHNFADYFTKHHSPAHHKRLRPIYLHEATSLSDVQGCIRAMGAPSGPTRLRAPKRVLTSTSPSSAPPAAVNQPQQLAFHVALTRLTRAATRATRQQPRSLTARFTSSLRAHNIC